jgi:hypothetical protein
MDMDQEAITDCTWNLMGAWTSCELNIIRQIWADISKAVGGASNMTKMFGNVDFEKKVMTDGGEGNAHHVWMNSDSSKWNSWSATHELGHAWDGANGWMLSNGLQKNVNSRYPKSFLRLFTICYGSSGNGPGATGWPVSKSAYGHERWVTWKEASRWNAKEDFAQSFAAYIYPGEAAKRLWDNYHQTYGSGYSSFHDTPRGQYIASLLPSGNPNG